MTELHQSLNETYEAFVDGLVLAFPDVVSLRREEQYVKFQLEKNGMNTVAIYNHISGNVVENSTRWYEKDETIFQPAESKKSAIDLIEVTGLREIWKNYVEEQEEKDDLWESLQNLCQCIGVIRGSSRQYDQFNSLAKTFMAANPKLPPDQLKSQIISQMFFDPKLSAQTQAILLNTNTTEIKDDLILILKAQGLTANVGNDKPSLSEAELEELKQYEDEDASFEEEDAKATVHETATNLDEVCKQMQKDRLHKERDIRRAKRAAQSAPRTNPIADVLAMMEGKELSESDKQEMKELTKIALGNNIAGVDAAQQKSVRDIICSMTSNNGNMTSSMDQLQKLASEACGENMDDASLKQMQALFSRMGA